MRPIKFRAWDKKDGLWIAGFVIGQSGVLSEQGDKVFMQFTGLLSKSGKEIYEGDVVKDTEGRTAFVKWEQEDVAFIAWSKDNWNLLSLGNKSEVEVIGNIYSNPELIK